MSTLLRKQFNDHMILRGFSPKTKDAYIGAVAGLAKYYHLSPDKLNNDQIQAYLLHLINDRKAELLPCGYFHLHCGKGRMIPVVKIPKTGVLNIDFKGPVMDSS